MEFSTLEYIIKQKNEGKMLLKRIGLFIAYIVLFAILAVTIILFAAPAFQMLFIVLDLILCSMVAFISWRFVSVEYELTFGGGEICVTVIYGRSMRAKRLNIAANSLSEVGIYDDGAYEKLCRMSLRKNYIFVSSMAAETIYYAIFDEDKDRCVLYFEADERAIAYLRRENSGALRAGNIK